MSPTEQTLTHLRAYFEATAALRAFVLTTNTQPTENAFFLAKCGPGEKPSFSYEHFQPDFTNHATLRMRPLLPPTRAAWASFVQHARICSPSFAALPILCIQRLWHDGIDDTTPFHDQPIFMIIGEDKATVPTVDAYIDHVRRVLHANAPLGEPG